MQITVGFTNGRLSTLCPAWFHRHLQFLNEFPISLCHQSFQERIHEPISSTSTYIALGCKPWRWFQRGRIYQEAVKLLQALAQSHWWRSRWPNHITQAPQVGQGHQSTQQPGQLIPRCEDFWWRVQGPIEMKDIPQVQGIFVKELYR